MIEPVTSQVSARRTCHKIEGKPLVVVGGQITTSEYGGMRKSDFYQQVGPHHDPDWAWEYRHRERARLQDQQQSPEDAVFSQQIVPMCEQAIRKAWGERQLANVETAISIFRLRILNERSYQEVSQAVGLSSEDVARLSRRITLICKQTVLQVMEEELTI